MGSHSKKETHTHTFGGAGRMRAISLSIKGGSRGGHDDSGDGTTMLCYFFLNHTTLYAFHKVLNLGFFLDKGH